MFNVPKRGSRSCREIDNLKDAQLRCLKTNMYSKVTNSRLYQLTVCMGVSCMQEQGDKSQVLESTALVTGDW